MHVVLFLLTLVTTTIAGALSLRLVRLRVRPARRCTFRLALLLHGLWYSGTLLGDPRRARDGPLPALPALQRGRDAALLHSAAAVHLLTGTLGAVIRIREAFPTRTVLFDIGVAGPIAGFVVLLPALFSA